MARDWKCISALILRKAEQNFKLGLVDQTWVKIQLLDCPFLTSDLFRNIVHRAHWIVGALGVPRIHNMHPWKCSERRTRSLVEFEGSWTLEQSLGRVRWCSTLEIQPFEDPSFTLRNTLCLCFFAFSEFYSMVLFVDRKQIQYIFVLTPALRPGVFCCKTSSILVLYWLIH